MRAWRGFAALALLFATSAIAQDRALHTLTIAGAVAKPTTYTPATIATTLRREVSITAPDGSSRRYGGVLLRDLLTAAQPREEGRFDLRQSIVVAHATDGYVAIFSWAELFNSPIGDGVLVATTRDGAPIDDAEGEFTLVSAADTRAGPRHVRWLDHVEMRRVTP